MPESESVKGWNDDDFRPCSLCLKHSESRRRVVFGERAYAACPDCASKLKPSAFKEHLPTPCQSCGQDQTLNALGLCQACHSASWQPVAGAARREMVG
ncbi:MAG: hypothetical protein JWO59_696 [Chloroflexi bacterium]|nr:hypothetical protein [Chloroflexota bacterium]